MLTILVADVSDFGFVEQLAIGDGQHVSLLNLRIIVKARHAPPGADMSWTLAGNAAIPDRAKCVLIRG